MAKFFRGLHMLLKKEGKSMNKKVTILGGGTGMSSLLLELKKFPIDITSVITVSDNGRSTGRLRREFKTPAVGDIRKVITNLSEVDPIIKQMMEYRFTTSSDLDGQSLGNLILTALLDLTGNLEDSIKALSKLFHVEQQLLPISEDSSLTLMGETISGEVIEGEAQITKSHQKFKRIYYKEEPHVLPGVITAIKQSDLIIFSMGSLYTSLLPNIICKEVQDALEETKAPIMYICNAMTQPGETDQFTVSDHVKLINEYLERRKIDVVIASNSIIPEEIAKKYETEEQKDPVVLDRKNLEKLEVELIEGDLLTVINHVIRHNSLKLSSSIFAYLMRD